MSTFAHAINNRQLMTNLLRYLLCTLSVMCSAMLAGQPRFRLMTFDDMVEEAPLVSRMVRDGQGMMWFSTSDGLYRFDGYEFRNFKTHSGDGINMTSNRITSLYSSSTGSLWCLVEGRVFLFDTRQYRYVDVLADYEQQLGKQLRISKVRALPCGTTWLFTEDQRMLALSDERPASSVRQMAVGESGKGITVVCDLRERSWVLTKRHTYLYDGKRLVRFPKSFLRVISNDKMVWLVADDGSLWLYNERRENLFRWKHPLLTTAITDHAELDNKSIALCTESGILLLAPDGRQLTATGVTWPVRKIIQDKDGLLWLLGKDGRFFLADSHCRQVDEIAGIRMADFNMHSDKDGTRWFFADNGDTYYATSDDLHRLCAYSGGEGIGKISNSIYDGQGGCWLLRNGKVCRLTFENQHYRRLPMHHGDQVRAVFKDAQGRMMVATRNDEDLTVYSETGETIGWMGSDGSISKTWQPFGAAVYSSLLTDDGTLWLGTKRHGVLRLRPREDGNFQISQFQKDEQNPYAISDNEIYDFATDRRGRIWVATRHGGLCCISNPQAEVPQFIHSGNQLKGWKESREVGISKLLVLPTDHLLVGTYAGLFVADISSSDLTAITFSNHRREANRKESLSSSNITDLLQTIDGKIFLATADGGINQLLTKDVEAPQLDFHHYELTTGFPADITWAMAEYDGSLWVTSTNRLIEMRLKETEEPDVNTFLMRERPNFSQAAPLQLEGSKWVFGALDGTLLIDLKQLKTSSFTPPLVITGVTKEGGGIDYAAGSRDTILLASTERDLTIWFSALDYEDARHVVYAYRMGKDRPWKYLGQNHSLALSQMQPGTYHIAIRSTNSDGVWCNNERTMTIIVKPTFWETPWAFLLGILAVAAVTGLVLYILLYIRRLKRQQHEALEKYLALLEMQHPQVDDEPADMPQEESPKSRQEEADDMLMKRLVRFVEENLGDSNVSIDDMAQACAVSRTSLHRKVKEMTGTSPMEFMREARIRKAIHLVEHSGKSVSEIAYDCGFSDPKYFSKCFKAATGKTPTEYKNS